MIYVNKKTGWHYLMNWSDNLGMDCYIFNEKLEYEDGYFPFARDCMPDDKDEFIDSVALINKWENEMTEEDSIAFCLKEMGTDIKDCILVEDEELEEELSDKC